MGSVAPLPPLLDCYPAPDGSSMAGLLGYQLCTSLFLSASLPGHRPPRCRPPSPQPPVQAKWAWVGLGGLIRRAPGPRRGSQESLRGRPKEGPTLYFPSFFFLTTNAIMIPAGGFARVGRGVAGCQWRSQWWVVVVVGASGPASTCKQGIRGVVRCKWASAALRIASPAKIGWATEATPPAL